MKKLMNKLMLSCKKASALIIKRNDFRLTRVEKVQLFFHLLMCGACHRFDIQNKFLNKALEQQIKESEEVLESEEAPEGLKENIISRLVKPGL
jgi:hypothetical protein